MLTRLISLSVLVFLPGIFCNFTLAQVPNPDANRGRLGRFDLSQDENTLLNDVDQTTLTNSNLLGRVKFAEAVEFVSAAGRVLGLYTPKLTDRSPAAMTKAATKFISLLDKDQTAKAVHKLDSKERKAWTNLPPRPNAGGVRLDSLNEEQLNAACDLIATLLSPKGYEKMRLIMLAADQLAVDSRRGGGFGAKNYSIVIFGEPSESKTWSFQLDGHHLGLNLTIKGKQITMGPSFIGVQPAEFELGGNNIRPLESETVVAFHIIKSFSDEQFRAALVGERRGQIRTGPGKDGLIPEPRGIECKSFDENQRKWLLELIGAWAKILPGEQAKKRLQEIESEIDQAWFSWSGPRQPGSDVSYTIQTPSLIIEFAYQDAGGGDPLNHLHTQYRDLKNEYGKQFDE